MDMPGQNRQIVFLRYWGSHFKSRRQANNLARQFEPLLRRNWQCHLVVERLPDEQSWLEPFQALGVRLVVVPRPKGNFDLKCVARACALCRRLKCSVFHCDNMHTSPLLGAFLARAKVRIWSKRSMSAHYELGRHPGLRERLALATRTSSFCATRIFAVSRNVQKELVAMGIPQGRVVVRHNPRMLPVDRIAYDRTAVRQSLGLADADKVIITIGHAVPVKGWDLLARAFSHVAEAEPHARLILVGSFTAPHERACYADLERWIATHGLKPRVTFTGHVGDVGRVLQAADMFVMPSRSEGFSLALVEALQAGLPCIATRVGIAEDVIQDGVNGFLVGRGDEGGLAQAILRLTREDALRKRLAQNAVAPTCIPTLPEYAENLACDYESLLAMSAGGSQPELKRGVYAEAQ
jgi:glycosyltransferase involved in cell wall biosynthesis